MTLSLSIMPTTGGPVLIGYFSQEPNNVSLKFYKYIFLQSQI